MVIYLKLKYKLIFYTSVQFIIATVKWPSVIFPYPLMYFLNGSDYTKPDYAPCHYVGFVP